MPAVRKYKNLYVERDDKNIAWLHFDKENSSTNVLSTDVLEEFDLCLDFVENTNPTALVILSAKKSGFIAGADISEFSRLKDEGEALALIERGQEVFSRLEKLPFPTVATIHGFCLGGGLELALACKYRVAQENEGTSLGLPEVRLGIHPGFGGTVRATRLLGGIAGLDIILTGRTLNAKAAKKIGLVDMLAPARHLKTAALSIVAKPPLRKGRSLLGAAADSSLARPFIAKKIAAKLKDKVNPHHYPAPYAVVELWSKFGSDFSQMMAEEARSVSRLIIQPTAQNLVRVYGLQETLKGFGKKTGYKAGHLHVIGAGAMGGDIAAWSALRGLTVTLQDREVRFVAPAIKRAHDLFNKRLKEKRLVQAAMDRLIPDVKGSGAQRADVIIEAVFEDLGVKRDLFKSLEAGAKPGAVLATNTSSIPLEEIAAALAKPQNLVGIHFFNPVAQMQLVEVVRGSLTSQEVFDKALGYVGQIGKLPLPVKSSPGFLVNRVLVPYLMEGIILEQEGVPKDAIDHAATEFGMPMGPLLLADTVGLDICYHVGKIFSSHMGMAVPERLEELVKAGRLGKKSGRGFYEYRDGKQLPSSGGRAGHVDTKAVTDRLMFRYLNECVACLREGVVENGDLADAGMIFGTGFAPFRGGPMKYASDCGMETMIEGLKDLEKKFGPRFRADAGWGLTKKG